MFTLDPAKHMATDATRAYSLRRTDLGRDGETYVFTAADDEFEFFLDRYYMRPAKGVWDFPKLEAPRLWLPRTIANCSKDETAQVISDALGAFGRDAKIGFFDVELHRRFPPPKQLFWFAAANATAAFLVFRFF